MRYLGIDYGLKRVGIALSDETGTLSFPKEILPNTEDLAEKIAELCREEEIGAVVMGESRNFKGEENPVMGKISAFKTELERKIKIPVHLEQEFLSSHEASKRADESAAAAQKRGDGRAGRNPKAKGPVDDYAAAIILQSFLDKQRAK